MNHGISASSPCIHDAEGRRRDIATNTCHQHKEMLPLKLSKTTMIWGSPPYLAVLTEPDACASIKRLKETLRIIEQATRDEGLDLVVMRVVDGPGNEYALRKWSLLKSLAKMKQKRRFSLVVNDDVDLVVKALSQRIAVDGVHVKENKSQLISSIRDTLEQAVTCALSDDHNNPHGDVIIGTSCHSLQSAQRSYQLSPHGPDYLFVGTCYLTKSHPEKKSLEQLEGPALPGRVRRELDRMYHDNNASIAEEQNLRQISALPPPLRRTSALPRRPVIYAIGGINEFNCHEPVVRFGADGVATIRTVMQAANPRETVRQLKCNMIS